MVLVQSYDHSYIQGYFYARTARYVKSQGYYCEDSGNDADHLPAEKVILALVQE